MNDNIVEQFQKKHESLAGIVHLASDMSEETGLKVWHPLELLLY